MNLDVTQCRPLHRVYMADTNIMTQSSVTVMTELLPSKLAKLSYRNYRQSVEEMNRHSCQPAARFFTNH